MHKIKKKTKNKIKKGSCYLLAGFSLICMTYFDLNIEKEEIFLANENKQIFKYIESKELLKILNKETGIIILINSKKTTNKIINLLYENKNKENIYIYNLIDDEIVLKLNKEDKPEIIQKPTNFYNELLKTLGSFKEEYILTNEKNEIIKTNYYKIFTPMVLFIKNGKILYTHYISNEEISETELSQIYNKGYEMLRKGYNL